MSSRNNYGIRKIKAKLRRKGIVAARGQKSWIMKIEGLVSRSLQHNIVLREAPVMQ